MPYQRKTANPQWNSRYHLSLLRFSGSNNSRLAKQLGGTGGFSVAAVLVAGLIVVLGSLTAVNRSAQSLIGGVFSSQSKEAREAAENGLTEIISTLNQPRNRGLLVAERNPSQWSNTDPLLVSECSPPNTPPTAAALTIGTSGLRNSAGAGNRRYYLKEVIYKSVNNGTRSETVFSRSFPSNSFTTSSNSFNPNDINIRGNNRGYLELVVVGQVLKAGTTTVDAEAEVRREYQIVPKCCRLSFGNTYQNPNSPVLENGPDARECNAFALIPIVVGTSIDVNGKSLTLTDSSNNPLLEVSTLNPDEDCDPISDCQIDMGTYTLSVRPRNLELPPLPSADVVSSIPGSGCINLQSETMELPRDGRSPSNGSNCDVSTETTTQTVWQYQSSTQGNNRNCPNGSSLGSSLPSGAITVDANLNEINLVSRDCYTEATRTATVETKTPYCSLNSGTDTWDCRIRFINLGGNSILTINSTDRPVRLFLYDSTGTSPAGGTVLLGGSSRLKHIICDSSGSCTDAGINNFSRFKMFGNVASQSIQLKGDAGALAGFFYLPFADVTLSGGGNTLNLSGVLWSDTVNLDGNVAMQFPTQFGNFLSTEFPAIDNGNPSDSGIRPGFDFVARAVSATNFFANP